MPVTFDDIEDDAPNGVSFDDIQDDPKPENPRIFGAEFKLDQLKEDWSPEKLHELKEALTTSPLQHIPRMKTVPEDSTLKKVGAGALDFAQGGAEFLTTPTGAALALAGGAIPGAARAIGAAFVPLLTKRAAELAGETSVTKDPRTATEGILTAATAALPVVHELKKASERAKIEPTVEPAPVAESKPLTFEDIPDDAQPPPVEAAKTEPAVEVKPEEVAEPISVGPGAASPGDVPAAPPLASVAEPPAPIEPLHPFRDLTLGMLGTAKTETGNFIKGAAGHSMPRTTTAAREVGEAGTRYASSRIAARPMARVFSDHVLEGADVDPIKFGVALAEDNLRSISQEARARETAAIAEGKPEEAAKAKAEAERVKSLIGAKKSPFKTEDEYQDFLAEPEVKAAIKRHIELWEQEVGPMYREAMRLDPDVELPSRGQQTGARVNLKARLAEDETPLTNPVGGGSSLTATFRRKSPFGVRAKGTGETYEGDYHSIIANTFERQLEIANKNAFDKALVQAGLAVIDRPGKRVEIGGKKAEAFPLSRKIIVATKPGEPASVIPKGENLYVLEDLAGEYRRAANVDKANKIPLFTPLMNQINRAALAGLTDFTVHLSNQMTALFDRPLSGKLLTDSLLSATGRADVPVTLTKYIARWFKNNPKQIAELAEIGALREQRPGSKWKPGKILEKSDEIVRSMLDDTWKQLAEDGVVENTETSQREYVNQIGQYNKRLQGPLKKLLRDTGFGPFVTAGTAFNALGVRMATLSPGAKAAGPASAVALRANVLSKWVGSAALIGAINYILTHDKGGGVMGRPGTPIGKIDTGKSDENDRPFLIPAADILGVGRALRVTGVGGVVNAKRFGLGNQYAVDSAVRDIVNSAVAPAAGPPVRFALTAAAGKAPAIGVKDTARPKFDSESQTALNLEAALKEANPVVNTYYDYKEGKPLPEVIANQIPRFTVTPGRPAEMMERYPEIVAKAVDTKAISYVIGEARRMAPERRVQYLEEMLQKMNPESQKYAIQEFRRRRLIP